MKSAISVIRASAAGSESALDSRRLVLCSLVALAGMAFTLICFYPGYMSFDSVVQLAEARSGLFTDAHPPVMAAVWRVADAISPGPQGMLLFHNLLFWSGAALLCYLAIPHPGFAAATVLLAGLFPPVFALLSTIWKDVGLGVSLFLAFALLVLADQRHSKVALGGSLLCMVYGFAVRHNGAIAVLPLVILAGFVFAKSFVGRSGLVWGLFFFILILVTVMLSDRLLAKGRTTYHYQGFLIHDLVGMSIRKSTVYLPPSVYWDAEKPSINDLRKIYDPANIVPLFGGDPSVRHLKFSEVPSEIAGIRKAWLSALLQAPGAYLDHRWIMFRTQLGLGRRPVCYPYQEGIEENSQGVSLSQTKLNSYVMEALARVRDTMLFRGWFFVLATLLLLLLTIALTHELRFPAIALAASSLLYESAYFFISPTCDFRFNWWTVVATVALVIYLLVPITRRLTAARAR